MSQKLLVADLAPKQRRMGDAGAVTDTWEPGALPVAAAVPAECSALLLAQEQPPQGFLVVRS